MRPKLLLSMVVLALLSAILSACGTATVAQSGDLGQIPTPPPAPTFPPAAKPVIPPAPNTTLPRAGTPSLAADTFDGTLDSWDVLDLNVFAPTEPSLWQVTEGRVDQVYGPDHNDTQTPTILLSGDENWTDYSVQAVAYPRGNANVGLAGRSSKDGLYILAIRPASTTGDQVTLQRYDAASEQYTILATAETGGLNKNAWYALKLSFQGDTIQAFVNGQPVLEAKDGTFASGRAGLYAFAEGDVSFDNFSVQSN
ncbi:MAG TPA: family 16 glycoside hydrolase [Herpetosiphonaceae bacterium]|nr:family 16 glycoside hydrolase [Herpetosiphonaceae bacterium]